MLYYVILYYIILYYIILYYIILYLQAYSGYSDIIKHTMSKAKEINAIAFAKTLLLSLQQVRLLIFFSAMSCYCLLLAILHKYLQEELLCLSDSQILLYVYLCFLFYVIIFNHVFIYLRPRQPLY